MTIETVWHRIALRMLTVVLSLLLLCSAVAGQAPVNARKTDWFTYYFFDNYGFALVFVIGFAGLFVYRKLRKPKRREITPARPEPRVEAQRETQTSERRKGSSDRRKTAQPASIRDQSPTAPAAPETVASDYTHVAFGAYRIDQEVGKLVLGKPHRLDVLASRAPDDRRAVEASLVKALNATDTDDTGRELARSALEDYGFVARQSALLLQGRDAWERSSAARVLGQIGSPASLPALIEALHDTDSVVRNQAVTSLGQLRNPAAIGALLDVARRYSDIPPSLLSESLSACSVDGLAFFDSAGLNFDEPSARFGAELQDVDQLSALPTGDEDDALLNLLSRFKNSDTHERAQIAGELGMHSAQRSVSALSAAALHDPHPSVRSAAVAGLGTIDHESVFAPVLIALADETREVRAAAARTLSGLHFDRAEAYLRVIETADQQTLQEFAQACIKTGIVGQAVDRLGSEDRRQSHEAFSLFSVLARAGELQPIFDIVQNNPDLRVKLTAVRVLNVAGSEAVPRLREIVSAEGMAEDVRTSILELLYKLDKEPAVV